MSRLIYKKFRAQVQFEVSSAHKQYMQDVVSDSYKGNLKKFWSSIKSTGNESTGESPLKNDDFIITRARPTFSVQQPVLISVFTEKVTSELDGKGPSPNSEMPDISINWKCVNKLLNGLKSFQATGPDSFPAFILKQLITNSHFSYHNCTRALSTVDRSDQTRAKHGLHRCLRRETNTK